MSDKAKKYLQKYGYSSYKIISEKKSCKYAVVVPAIAEYDNIIRFLNSFVQLDNKYFADTLLLFVINNHQNSPSEIKLDNARTIEFLKDFCYNEINIGCIDASSRGNEFPEKDSGVGLARKIGMDAVLNFFPDISKAVIICTDADCTFENNYLTQVIDNFHNTDAAVIRFEHKCDIENTAAAVINYEIFLRYYVIGLKYAESPYAFHTIGSSMACSAEAYINSEGMNKRKAAEDFYFLEKLAKKYSIKKINSTTVFPSSRTSWRVPFGTGQRMTRFLSNTKDEYVLYHPDCFKILSEWHKIFFKSDILDTFEYLNSAKKISVPLYDFLAKQGFEKDWNNILKNSKEKTTAVRQKKQWFDGFRTLKLIHHLRDNGYGNISMFEALDMLFEMISTTSDIKRSELIPGIQVQLKYLEKLREIDNR